MANCQNEITISRWGESEADKKGLQKGLERGGRAEKDLQFTSRKPTALVKKKAWD